MGSKVIIGVFRIDNIDRRYTEQSLVSFGFPTELIPRIIRALHREDQFIQYLTFSGKRGHVGVSYDYPEVLNKEKYAVVSFNTWAEFQAKANLLGSV